MRAQSAISADVVVIGIDLAKKSFVAVGLPGSGQRTKPRKCENRRRGFESLLEFAGEISKDQAGFVVAFEPTGHYGESLTHWLMDEGVPLYQVQPLHTKRAKELFDGTRRKTDAKDAAVVAELCRRGVGRPFSPPDGAFAELRVLARQREQLVKRRSQLQNRLHRHLDVVFPELVSCFYKLNSSGCRYILSTAPTPQDLLDACPLELATGLRTASKGALGEPLVEQLREAARDSSGISRGLSAHRLAIRQSTAELEDVEQRVLAVEAQMHVELMKVDYAQRLLSIPRLGATTAAILLAEFGDLRSYRVAKQLIAMAGLDLIEQSSGDRKGRRHISRRGRRYARQILYLAVLRLGWNVLSEARRRLVEENKLPPTKAAVANMCRLLKIIHALVRDDVDFDASMHQPSAEATV